MIAATLAACSGPAQEPSSDAATSTRSDPTRSPSPSASAVTGVEKPERPAAMKKKDAEGAAAAAEYFLSLYDYTKRSGDTREWDGMSHRSCQFCETVHARALEIQQRGLVLEGGGLTADVTRKYDRDAATAIFPLDVQVTQDKATATYANGQVESSSEPQRAEMRVEMGLRHGDWTVVSVVPKPES